MLSKEAVSLVSFPGSSEATTADFPPFADRKKIMKPDGLSVEKLKNKFEVRKYPKTLRVRKLSFENMGRLRVELVICIRFSELLQRLRKNMKKSAAGQNAPGLPSLYTISVHNHARCRRRSKILLWRP